VAKSKTTGAKPVKAPGEKPRGAAKKDAKGRPYRAIAFRVYQDYDKWIQEFAERERASVATLIDQALAAYARERGYSEPPKRV